MTQQTQALVHDNNMFFLSFISSSYLHEFLFSYIAVVPFFIVSGVGSKFRHQVLSGVNKEPRKCYHFDLRASHSVASI